MIANKIKDNKDNIYFNAVINADPTSTATVRCEYIGNLTQSILDTPKNYYCSIIRFILPIDAIPTLIFPLDIDQSNFLQSRLQIGINLGGSYPNPSDTRPGPVGGTNYVAPVIYVPGSNLPPPITSSIVAPYYTNTQAISAFYWVYSIEQMIGMFNNTLNTAMIAAGMSLLYIFTLTGPSNATIGDIYEDSTGKKYQVNGTIVGGTTLALIDAANSGVPLPITNGVLTKILGAGDATISYISYTAMGIPRPYFTWNPLTNLISLTVTDAFLTTGAKIFVNRYMINYLASFKWFYDETTFSLGQYFFLNTSVLPPDQTSPYIILEDYTTISLWFDLRRILIFSNTLPITPEVLPGSNNQRTTSTVAITSPSNSNVVNYYPIITDFAVGLENANQLQEVLVYNPSAQYRLVDMTSDSPLNKIDLQFFWEDRYNNIIPVPLSTYQQASVKLLFTKKSIYNVNPKSW